MPIVRSPKRVLKPAKAKGVKRAKASSKTTPVRKAVARKVEPAKIAKTKAAPEKSVKRPRAKVLNEHPDNIVVDQHDGAAVEAVGEAKARADRAARAPRKRTAADRAAEPSLGEAPATSLVARVSDAIERELSKIERIIGNPTRLAPAQRVETESRARVLASLARTLKEVMRLREQERGAGDDKAKAADDDAVPRDLDEFRRELSRRLEGLVAVAAPVSDRGNEPG